MTIHSLTDSPVHFFVFIFFFLLSRLLPQAVTILSVFFSLSSLNTTFKCLIVPSKPRVIEMHLLYRHPEHAHQMAPRHTVLRLFQASERGTAQFCSCWVRHKVRRHL